MVAYPPALRRLITHLAKLPGIGEKTATRLALYLFRAPGELAQELAASIVEVKKEIGFCSRCFNLADEDPCLICRDANRDTGILCVVEEVGDLLALETAGVFKGRYHVLQGVLAPLDGVGPEDLRIKELLERLGRERVEEVILALNPSTEGEATAAYLAKLLADRGIRVSRIAQGIPMGGDLKYSDAVTLQRALEGRRQTY
ncbi:MAG: recombination protein RecR [Deltaproteobacteria bacterium]|nr:recombination protein RecR [Deltaproteobacteria bacterium]MBW2070431.1 recombination protein RecR [Deltaproteobacteria bacterium]